MYPQVSLLTPACVRFRLATETHRCRSTPLTSPYCNDLVDGAWCETTKIGFCGNNRGRTRSRCFAGPSRFKDKPDQLAVAADKAGEQLVAIRVRLRPPLRLEMGPQSGWSARRKTLFFALTVLKSGRTQIDGRARILRRVESSQQISLRWCNMKRASWQPSLLQYTNSGQSDHTQALASTPILGKGPAWTPVPQLMRLA